MKTNIILVLTLFAMQISNAQLKPIAYADGQQKLNGFDICNRLVSVYGTPTLRIGFAK